MCSSASAQSPATIAVDFEGVKLCRHGELCLAQFCLYIDPCTVYVLDVYKLGKECFTMTNERGVSIKSIMEEKHQKSLVRPPQRRRRAVPPVRRRVARDLRPPACGGRRKAEPWTRGAIRAGTFQDFADLHTSGHHGPAQDLRREDRHPR